MKKPLTQGYRLSFYKNTSDGGWFTVGEYRTLERAETERNKLCTEKGIRQGDTSIAHFS